jgi:DNA-directed RNA polymerase subunit RPC12/RpoP
MRIIEVHNNHQDPRRHSCPHCGSVIEVDYKIDPIYWQERFFTYDDFENGPSRYTYSSGMIRCPHCYLEMEVARRDGRSQRVR